MSYYCSYLLPRQDGGTSQIKVNRRFLPFGMVPLYIANSSKRARVHTL